MNVSTDLIHTIPKNSLEEVRFNLASYKGHGYCDIRQWYRENEKRSGSRQKRAALYPQA
jgi:hypothetical protein